MAKNKDTEPICPHTSKSCPGICSNHDSLHSLNGQQSGTRPVQRHNVWLSPDQVELLKGSDFFTVIKQIVSGIIGLTPYQHHEAATELRQISQQFRDEAKSQIPTDKCLYKPNPRQTGI